MRTGGWRMPRPIIIDCDPGQDDAVALLLALASPDELEVLGVTCVAGNVPLPLTQRNARIVCELAGRTEVPVFAGCPRPILRPLRTAAAVHGKTGLDGAPLPERSEEHTSELQSLMRISYAVFCLQKKNNQAST